MYPYFILLFFSRLRNNNFPIDAKKMFDPITEIYQ